MPLEQPDGFLALPKTGQGPGVLLLHAWWGLNPFFKSVCERLAGEGFVVFAPDLYHGKLATTIAEADALSNQLQETEANRDIASAIAYLHSLKGVTGPTLGVIGFSLGTYLALGVSLERPQDIGAVVFFYGTRPGDFASSRAAYLGHFAETDEYEPTANVKPFQEQLELAHRPATFYTYAGTGHWFFEQDRADAYNAQAAELAWQRTVEFLRKTLAQ